MPKDLVSQLLLPTAYPHPVAKIELRETHISWVFLTGDWAYKVKKPRNLGFLDYSSLDARKHFCEQELALNRRFAPKLYMEVVPICEQRGLHIGAGGSVVDYAVKMRQFDDDQLLSNIAERDGLEPALIRKLGALLAHTHADLDPVYPDTGAGTPLAMQDAMVQNFEQIEAYELAPEVAIELQQVKRWATHRLVLSMPTMIRRISAGLVKDCHGDLHLGNIARIDGVLSFFDCIEFSDNFRIMDSIAELAFLVMDCQARSLQTEANQLLNDYLEYSGDYEGLALLDWYRCYYAVVRAKVNLLRIEDRKQTDLTATGAYRDFRRYLDLALSYTLAPDKFLAIGYGVSGSGKSTVAMQLAQRTGAIRVRSDVERKRLFKLAPEASSYSHIEGGIYTAAASRRTFARLQSLAGTVVEAGFPCIVDATFLRQKQRKPFSKLAEVFDVPFIVLHCKASKRKLRERITLRNSQSVDASEADVTIMEKQLGKRETPGVGEADAIIEIKAGTSISSVLQQIRQAIEVACSSQ